VIVVNSAIFKDKNFVAKKVVRLFAI